ncbi:tetratricopeptide repeat protein [Lysobacter sp. A421]
MFAALKRLETSGASPAGTAVRDGTPRHNWRLLQRWSPPLVAVMVLLCGWWWFPPAVTQPADSGAAMATATVSIPTVPPPTNDADDSRATTFALTPVAANETALVPVVAKPAVVSPVAATTPDIQTTANSQPPAAAPIAQATPSPAPTPTPQPADQVAPQKQPQPQPLVDAISIRDASEATVPEDGQSVARAVAALGTSIKSEDFVAGAEQLALLSRLLPPQSLTLLRMQAWLAHESGDTAGALVLYRRIVARMPGDQTAVINLAILEARTGEAASARQRLQRLRSNSTDSREIDQAIGLVEAQLR